MRKFYLELDGVRISLNNESGILFTNPSGLGTTMANSFAEISDGFFRRTEKKQKQGSIAGDLTFFSSAYTSYETFVNSLFTAKKIVFVYDPAGAEYSIDVALNYITKTESVLGAYMTVPISFIPLSMWYTEETLTGSSPFSISAGGHIGAAVELSISGTFMGNEILIADEDGTIADVVIDNVSLTEINYSNFYNDCYINGTDGGGNFIDLTNRVDLTKKIYGHNSGKAFTVTVTNGNVTGTVRRYWRTV